MDLIWILTGGEFDITNQEIKIYNLIEYDNLENAIKISEFNKRVCAVSPQKINNNIIKEIHEELNKGKKLLCKNEIYYNGNRLFDFGYYSKKNGEYKYTRFSDTKNKVMYKKLIGLLIDNCIIDLP
jgi:hypothetical protein